MPELFATAAWLDEHTFLTEKKLSWARPFRKYGGSSAICVTELPRTTSRRESCRSGSVRTVGLVGDVGLIEVHVGTARGRTALALIVRTGLAEPYGCSAGELSWKKHICPIFMPGHSFTGSVDTLDSSSVMCPSKPGSMKPAVEWVRMPRRPSELFAFKTARRSSHQSFTYSPCGPERKLARVQNPRLVRPDFELLSQLALVLRRIHIRIRMVVEQTEEPVQTHVNRSRLHHLQGPRIEWI